MMTGRPVIQHSLATIDSVEKELIFFRECRSFCHFVIGPAEHCRTTVVYSLLRSQMSRIWVKIAWLYPISNITDQV